MINFSVRDRFLALAMGAAFLVACGGSAHPASDRDEGRLWVLAPHPDDEVLMAGELLRQSVARGRPVTVLVMTNGDLSCTRNGHLRQAETIAALASLGVTEEHVHFLGYPDGWLDALGPMPFGPLLRTQQDGSCGTGDRTYASRGAGGHDLHYWLRGVSTTYDYQVVIDDLAAMLQREHPTEIVTTHGIDTHPDHAMTYVYLRRALEQAAIPSIRILRSIVHQGPCWPNGASGEPCPDVHATQSTPFPALGPPLVHYAPTMYLASGDHGLAKRAAIAHYVTQLEAPDVASSWLSSFAREDEPFYPELLVTDPAHEHRLVREPSDVTDVAAFGRIELSSDETGATLTHDGIVLRHWPVPHGEDATALHRYETIVEPRPSDGPVAEISVRRDGVFWMSAVVALTAAEPTISEAGKNTDIAR
jgi:LmbE family N-acetylglucosaminyl deacetylase